MRMKGGGPTMPNDSKAAITVRDLIEELLQHNQDAPLGVELESAVEPGDNLEISLREEDGSVVLSLGRHSAGPSDPSIQ